MVSLSDIQYIKTRDKKEGLALLKKLLKIKDIKKEDLEAFWHEVKVLDENDAKEYIVNKNKEAKKKPKEKKEETKEENKQEKKKVKKDLTDYYKKGDYRNVPPEKKPQAKITNFFKKVGIKSSTPIPKKKKDEGPHEKPKIPLVGKKDTARKELGKNQSKIKKKGQLILDDYISERTEEGVFNKVADFFNVFQDRKKEDLPSAESVKSITKSEAKSVGNTEVNASKSSGKSIGKGIFKGAKWLFKKSPQFL